MCVVWQPVGLGTNSARYSYNSNAHYTVAQATDVSIDAQYSNSAQFQYSGVDTIQFQYSKNKHCLSICFRFVFSTE